MEVLHILIRVSTQVQEDGTSLKTQEEQGVELSKRLKMNYKIHNEGGTASNKDTLDNRPVMLNQLNCYFSIVNTFSVVPFEYWYINSVFDVYSTS